MNKTFLLLMVFLASFSGCGKDEDGSGKAEQEIWIGGYTALSNDLSYKWNSVEFLFFEANNGEVFKEERHSFNGTISDYQSITDDIFNSLCDGYATLKDGTKIRAVKSKLTSILSDKYESIHLPVGRYYVVAIYQGNKDGYLWLYSNKYTGKYYEVKSQYNPPVLDVVFPCDKSRYGFIDWVSSTDKFDYEFVF